MNSFPFRKQAVLYKNPGTCKQFARIFFMIYLVTGLGFAWLWFNQIPEVQQALLNERIQATRNLVEVVNSMLFHYQERAAAGQIPLAEAKQRALHTLKNIRYSTGQYFWVHDLTPTMLMHPVQSNLDGTNLTNFRDAAGRLLFVEMNQLVLRQQQGSISYLWPRPQGGDPERKTSWVSLYQPWNWVVGSGIYLDDLARDFTLIRKRLLISGISAFGVMSLIAMYLVYRINKPVILAQQVADRITAGEAWDKLKIDDTTESGKLVGIIKGLTEDLRQAKQQAEAANADKSAILHAAGDGIIGLDRTGSITFANRSAELLTGRLTDEMLGNNIHELFRHSSRDDEPLPAEQCQILRCCRDHSSTELSGELFHRKDGSSFPVNYLVTPLGGDRDGAVLVFRDITEQQEMERRIIWMAQHDPLTGLLNRNAFEERASCLEAICRREQRSIALLYIDLDGFKQVNDRYGHDTGDAVLREVSERLRSVLREVDITARFGGDEFVTALQVTPDQPDSACQIAERLVAVLGTPFSQGGREIRIGASIGIAGYDPGSETTLDQAIRWADQALYQAKREGKNRVVVSSDPCGSPHLQGCNKAVTGTEQRQAQ